MVRGIPAQVTEGAAGFTDWVPRDLLELNSFRFATRPAYVHGSTILTHSQLKQRAARLAGAMFSVGVRRQDCVAVLCRNCIEFGVLLAAAALSGVILAPMNFRLTDVELGDAIARVGAKLLFCDGEHVSTASAVAESNTAVRQVICFEESPDHGARSVDTFVSTAPWLIDSAVNSTDIACLLFTSGTTGAAKCAVIGQHELTVLGWAMNAEMRTGSEDTVLIAMPMFHIGAIGIIAGLHARGGAALLQQRFDPAEAFDLILQHGITALHVAPVMLASLLRHAAGRVLPSVHTVV